MPVLLKSSDAASALYSGIDMDHLISDVRERLCINKGHPQRVCSASRRSAPYQISKRPFHNMCEQCKNKHYSSPNSCLFKSHPVISSKTESCCSFGHRKPCSKNQSRCSESEKRDSTSYQDPRVLLEKLIAEQSLIQEAVRRLQSRNSREQMCSAKKLFSLVSNVDDEEDEDSNDQYSASSRQTPFSMTMSESEDDAVSQHSIDL